MMKTSRLSLALFGALLACAYPASSVTLVNASGGALSVTSPILGSSQVISPGQQFAVPADWGDDRHVYLDLQTGGGSTCTTLQDRYGTIKVPTHWVGLSVESHGDCQVLAELPTAPEPPPAPPEPEPETDPPAPPVEPDDGEPSGPVDNPGGDTVDRGFPPRGNGTWVYDATFPNGPSGQPFVAPGLWRDALSDYNRDTAEPHRLDQVFSYGGDLEMECRGGSDCTQDKMHVYYYPPSAQHRSRSILETGASGFVSTQAYAETTGAVAVIPIFDGRFDAGGYLQEFTTLSEEQARTYANIFSRTVCADPALEGVQLDLEPFDIGDPAQAWFYDQLATNLAGENQELEPVLQCKTSRHPKGRFFSVFTFANQITPELGEIFTRHGNGYVIISLYDLGPGRATVASDPSDYRGYVENEIARTVSNSIAAGDVPFQLAIPAAASTKEFETYRGANIGHPQTAYVTEALDAIDASGVRQDEKFLGVAVWGWSRFMAWPPHSEDVFEPGSPPEEVLSILRDRL